MRDEQAIEREINDKGLNAPRLTPDAVDATVMSEAYWRVPGSPVTVCALTLINGFVVVGTSAPVSAQNFDEGLGRRIARQDAREQIWKLEGYLLRQRMYEATAHRTV